MKRIHNIKLKVGYTGTNYHGYQIQPNLVTIEGTLKDAVEKTVKRETRITSAGRTDRGVHAMGQVVNFYSDTTIDLGNLPRVINYHLPNDISVLEAKKVPMEFHSRFDAKAKWYRYIIYNGRYRNPIYHNRAAFIRFPLDVEAMRRSLTPLPGNRDFKPFMGKYAVVKDTIRTLHNIKIKKQGELIIVDFYGRSFLKNMIRIIMGTAIQIGRHLQEEEDLIHAIEYQDKSYIGPTADACGLYLMKVEY
ncbi:MAG: tRNA pseudouridine(38-40) synthase TruA [Tissierellia bacterium]|nr:tRNA pseudouridine(38-40) synthase TruA [Tissierellia bacterium]